MRSRFFLCRQKGDFMQNYMEVTVLSTSTEVFRGRGGEPDKVMHRLYIAGNDGRVGYLYSQAEHAQGETVRLGLTERDGKLRLRVLKD